MTDTIESPTRQFDPVELEILWQSLISTVNEQARALQRAAFSPIVREAGDLANAVFDRRGRMVAHRVCSQGIHRRRFRRPTDIGRSGDRRRAALQRHVLVGRPVGNAR